MELVLAAVAMGVAIAMVYRSFGRARPLIAIGNVVNALIYIAGALLLRTVGLPALYAYLWPVPVVAIVWLIARRERRIS